MSSTRPSLPIAPPPEPADPEDAPAPQVPVEVRQPIAPSRPRKATRGQTLAHAQEVAQTYVGDNTALDAAFEAFGQFDGPQGAQDPQTIALAQARVRALLAPQAPRPAAPALVESKNP